MMATVKAVGRGTIPRPPRKSPITLTPSAMNQLLRLAQLRRTDTPSSSTIASLQQQQQPTAVKITTESPTDILSPPHTYAQQKSIKDYIKVAVRTKGCSGNAYTLDWVTAKQKLDEEVSVADNLSILIDSKALFTLLGSQMDYVDEKLSAGFVFRNPNVKETCGCGMSFIV